MGEFRQKAGGWRLEESHVARRPIARTFDSAPWLTKTGLWFQVVDQGSKSDNWNEGSGSGMFVYTLSGTRGRGAVCAGSVDRCAPGDLRADTDLNVRQRDEGCRGCSGSEAFVAGRMASWRSTTIGLGTGARTCSAWLALAAEAGTRAGRARRHPRVFPTAQASKRSRRRFACLPARHLCWETHRGVERPRRTAPACRPRDPRRNQC
jgi:hypothetical protein